MKYRHFEYGITLRLEAAPNPNGRPRVKVVKRNTLNQLGAQVTEERQLEQHPAGQAELKARRYDWLDWDDPKTYAWLNSRPRDGDLEDEAEVDKDDHYAKSIRVTQSQPNRFHRLEIVGKWTDEQWNLVCEMIQASKTMPLRILGLYIKMVDPSSIVFKRLFELFLLTKLDYVDIRATQIDQPENLAKSLAGLETLGGLNLDGYLKDVRCTKDMSPLIKVFERLVHRTERVDLPRLYAQFETVGNNPAFIRALYQCFIVKRLRVATILPYEEMIDTYVWLMKDEKMRPDISAIPLGFMSSHREFFDHFRTPAPDFSIFPCIYQVQRMCQLHAYQSIAGTSVVNDLIPYLALPEHSQFDDPLILASIFCHKFTNQNS